MNNKEERVQKLIANYASLSRRQADKLIEEGKVSVNGKVIQPGAKGSINDEIKIDGKRVKFNLKHEYYLLNKPKGYICSREDAKGKEAISLINNYKNRNIFTVGRLDVATTGLIIITSDGFLSNYVMSPKSSIKKTYLVWVDKVLNSKQISMLRKGVELDDGYITKPVKNFKLIKNDKDSVLVKITITEGKKNQIRRMFSSIERQVINLKRVQIGYHKIDKIVNAQYKKLTKREMYEGLGIDYE